ncbi:MarR family winged helix-turn-helix transcriptional regulator [Gemella morbillorum]|jgi:transcriptional regulator, MarR family|uniref:MarR family winged helix-turn-helix transcriptional regulator n=1 Tax=Gemella morbillorum TaxID=29391 RepID=UPI001CB269DB|nr:MarR family transcriptional regulator [Gemella morbillorum]MBF1212336.1 MarR family transcriptional regulator [Gemella morbillorum]
MEVRDCIELLYNLKILDKKLIDLFEKKIGISLTRFQIIKYLHEVSFTTSKQLAQSLEIDAAAITRHLRILEQEGYVIKRRNEFNNREVFVELSQKALDEIGRCEKETNVRDLIGEEFTIEDLQNLVQLLNKFNKNFK